MSEFKPVVVYGDCLKVLRSMPDNHVHAIVTDPPYGLAAHKPETLVAALTAWVNGDREQVPNGKGFMGKEWDAFVPPPAVFDECLRVLKPGGHLVVFAGSRTMDLMGLSIRLAGFEIRDGLQWLYGSGFPKSMNVAKAITATERHGGANSVRIRKARLGDDYTATGRAGNRDGVGGPDANRLGDDPTRYVETELTENGQRWQGWGTALKPAAEPIILARKPLVSTVASNVLEFGTGGINVDGCRVGGGRFPANVLLSHGECTDAVCQRGCPVSELDAQSGITKSSTNPDRFKGGKKFTATAYAQDAYTQQMTSGEAVVYGDSGGASRFFPTFRYRAKAPKSERPKVDGVSHPTVKPLELMRWLVRLVTPPGGTVLDPFAGSGTTLQAARVEGFDSIGIEREEAYMPLISQRLEAA